MPVEEVEVEDQAVLQVALQRLVEQVVQVAVAPVGLLLSHLDVSLQMEQTELMAQVVVEVVVLTVILHHLHTVKDVVEQVDRELL
jgi:hypothetical protein